MASFPALSQGGAIATYPVTISSVFKIGRVVFESRDEQSYVIAPELAEFDLNLSEIPAYDVSNYVDFFYQQLGASGEWDLTIDGTTYHHIVFESDEFMQDQTTDGMWTLSFKCRQVKQ